jgi:haloalkane dehalogenase
VTEEKAKWYLDRLKNVKGVYVGQGRHFLQEDHPHQIGNEIAGWIDGVQFWV